MDKQRTIRTESNATHTKKHNTWIKSQRNARTKKQTLNAHHENNKQTTQHVNGIKKNKHNNHTNTQHKQTYLKNEKQQQTNHGMLEDLRITKDNKHTQNKHTTNT